MCSALISFRRPRPSVYLGSCRQSQLRALTVARRIFGVARTTTTTLSIIIDASAACAGCCCSCYGHSLLLPLQIGRLLISHGHCYCYTVAAALHLLHCSKYIQGYPGMVPSSGSLRGNVSAEFNDHILVAKATPFVKPTTPLPPPVRELLPMHDLPGTRTAAMLDMQFLGSIFGETP